MIVELHQLLAVADGDEPHRFVRAAKGDALAARRKGNAEKRIIADFEGMQFLVRFHVPDLNLAKSGLRAAADSEQLSVGRKGERFDARRFTDEPGDDF